MLQKAPLFLILLIIGTCFRKSHAALGGDKCDIPAVGSGPGASSTCTSTENGFCLLDHLTVTGNSPVTAVQFDGKCVCYYGYSGPKCATKTPTTSNSKSNTGTLLSAAALSALAAYYLSQNSNKDGYYYYKY